MTDQDKGLPPRVEIALEADYGTFRASVSGFLDRDGDAKSLVAALARALAEVNESRKDIDEALKGVHRAKAQAPEPRQAQPSQSGPPKESALPARGKAGILEFSENDVRYPPSAFKILGFPEAIALLMYEIDLPLMPARISFLINRGFKHIDPKNISSCLTNKTRYKLPKYVIRESAGWRLTGSGRVWVENEIIPSLKAGP